MHRSAAGLQHELLIHHDDDQLVAGTREFIAEGLRAGGQVLVHGARERLPLLRDAVGEHPRLQYAFDEDVYLQPMRTLFAYQRQLAEGPQPARMWMTGTLPVVPDAAARAAWARYESLVNEALGGFDLHALCTYDARTTPESTLAAARATHPTRTAGAPETRRPSVDYVEPADFLAHPLAGTPGRPTAPPTVTTEVTDRGDLASTRHLLAAESRRASAVPGTVVTDLVTAVNELVTNGLVHGSPPVRVTLWAAPATLACEVSDASGALDPVAGFCHPRDSGGRGLWMARQLVDDLFISRSPDGGTAVLVVQR
jgi:anti-sigma regulatory factor (Ser/Thr protein kinase)